MPLALALAPLGDTLAECFAESEDTLAIAFCICLMVFMVAPFVWIAS